jgi:hypothetical protein
MNLPNVVSRAEWLAARKELLAHAIDGVNSCMDIQWHDQ